MHQGASWRRPSRWLRASLVFRFAMIALGWHLAVDAGTCSPAAIIQRPSIHALGSYAFERVSRASSFARNDCISRHLGAGCGESNSSSSSSSSSNSAPQLVAESFYIIGRTFEPRASIQVEVGDSARPTFGQHWSCIIVSQSHFHSYPAPLPPQSLSAQFDRLSVTPNQPKWRLRMTTVRTLPPSQSYLSPSTLPSTGRLIRPVHRSLNAAHRMQMNMPFGLGSLLHAAFATIPRHELQVYSKGEDTTNSVRRHLNAQSPPPSKNDEDERPIQF